MVNKPQFIELVTNYLNKDVIPSKRMKKKDIQRVLDGARDVLASILVDGYNGDYGIHYPKIGKMQKIYCREKQYLDPRDQLPFVKESHYKVKMIISPKLEELVNTD